MVRRAKGLVVILGTAVLLASCGGGGSGAGPSTTPPPKKFDPSGTLTMTTTVDASGIHYSASIQLSEHGGLGASMGNVDMTYKVNGSPYARATFDSGQAWLGGTRLNALNNLGSNFLIAIDGTPTATADGAEAVLHYTDDNQKAGTMTLTATIPAPPGPPPNARFTVSGTVVESPGNFPVRDATVAVTSGATAGKSVQTDGNGHYTLSGIAGGPVTIRASKTEYDAVDQVINLLADGTLDFSMKKSGKVLPTVTAASPAWMRGSAVKLLRSIVE